MHLKCNVSSKRSLRDTESLTSQPEALYSSVLILKLFALNISVKILWSYMTFFGEDDRLGNNSDLRIFLEIFIAKWYEVENLIFKNHRK